MSVLTDEQLRVKALQIKNETTRKANTALRTGTLFEDIVDSKPNVAGGAGIPTNWNFATSGPAQDPPLAIGAYPTDLTKQYYATDDSVEFQGTLFWSNGAGGWNRK